MTTPWWSNKTIKHIRRYEKPATRWLFFVSACVCAIFVVPLQPKSTNPHALAGKNAPKIIWEDKLTEDHTGVLLNDGICMSDE